MQYQRDREFLEFYEEAACEVQRGEEEFWFTLEGVWMAAQENYWADEKRVKYNAKKELIVYCLS